MCQFLEWILDKQPESSSNPLVDYHWNFGPEKIKISEKLVPWIICSSPWFRVLSARNISHVKSPSSQAG